MIRKTWKRIHQNFGKEKYICWNLKLSGLDTVEDKNMKWIRKYLECRSERKMVKMREMEDRMWRFNIYLIRILEKESRKNRIDAINEDIILYFIW